MSVVRIATRGSDLALAQANSIAARIRAELERDTEIVVVKTTGDRIQDVSLAKIGGKGLFVKEIEEALLARKADVAVHSAKDLPPVLAPGLCLAAFPERQDARDALVGRRPDATVASLRAGARVGTGSARRTALLRAARPDVEVVGLRGNVPTRIAKLESEELDAVVLACAGLDRLRLSDRISERIPMDVMLPAACQGVLALEVREDDALGEALARLSQTQVALAVAAERSFLGRLGGDCTVPIAAHAELLGGARLRLRGCVASPDGELRAFAEEEALPSEAAALGLRVATAVLARGGDAILGSLGNPGSGEGGA